MTFLNPFLLFGALGVSLPILAHLLNRYQVKRTDWAAMRFLNRSVRVRSRQIRLKDILLLVLRCLALLFLVLALSRPVLENAAQTAGFAGERRAGVVIALDASYSMQHKEGGITRFQRALDKIDQIAATVRPGDPVTLCLLDADTRVVARNVAFDRDRFQKLLRSQEATVESLDMESAPRRLKDLAAELKAPQKEVYIVTDLQEKDWANGSAWVRESFKDLARTASVFVVPVAGGPENLAVTGLELVSGVLRKGTSARYRTTVRNYGTTTARNVRVTGRVNNIDMETKVIPAIAPGTSETVSLFLSFRDPGPVRITAEIGEDALVADNSRRTVAVIRDRVSVLCVEGDSKDNESAGRLIATALRARGSGRKKDDLDVQLVSWVDLPSRDLKMFDVVILADVPDITPEKARAFEKYVREGNGLIWFGGDQVKAKVWNERSALDGSPLLPAVIEEPVSTSDAMGVGRPLDPAMTAHAVCRPLLSLPEDLLSEARFRRVLRITPAASGMQVLSLVGSDSPILVEHSLGRGHVFMFTSSAGPAWNNMAVTPVFPMLLQQMVTYLTAREFETPRLVGESLSLSYVDQPDATDAVFDAPSGNTITVPVREYRNQYVAVLEYAHEAGFYLARVNLQAEGSPIAVNVDTREAKIKSLPVSDAVARLKGTGVQVAASEMDLLAGIEAARPKRSLWRVLLFAALAFLVIESLFAQWLLRKSSGPGYPGGASTEAGS